MDRLDDLLNKFGRMQSESERIAEEVITSKTVTDLMEDLNREQWRKGIRSDGTRMDTPPGQPYAASTVAYKKRKGQPTDRITLEDTGTFRNLLRVRKFAGLLEMWDDDVSLLEKLSVQYGDDILGITEENMDLLRELVSPEIVLKIEAYLKSITA